ncbi:CPBP family glutamic-type intramembrane protease [Thermosynechococcus sp. GLH187]|uniref:CPBP family glutamic-type intramembrane protease n=1 Tax=unclassified Thermosynechococcus TaxID=2622553 RepID=UPI002877E291|nr:MULTISPECIES: CPBP family glutamic-type intramembrane protease [unclassified Thermosynechococcus]WNC43900.1 CPBP family glutamic-type intramembrane protease [Thermosynechococcus sp. GLH187]WNC46436.1 CPBP family glutamic-type intramembrane protease [Thermosynechococcus sp. GLH333]WNC48973.1 CPBP family glutamic-type intramembrane protease [Thermosynechococcus sp. GLH87]
MSLKRLVLAALSVVVAALMTVSLLGSYLEPQAQGQINLFQTNLSLQAREWQGLGDATTRDRLVGNLEAAIQAYEAVLATPTPQNQPLRLQLGLLYAEAGQRDRALNTWQLLINKAQGTTRCTAEVLMALWADSPQLLPDGETLIKNTLQGWFRDRALERLYELQQRSDALMTLTRAEQQRAQAAFYRLALIGTTPLLGSLIGIVLWMVWIYQHLRRRHQGNTLPPLTPVTWGWETLWEGMVIWFALFFAISLVLMPLVRSLIGMGLPLPSAMAQTLYALVSYGMMMVAGLGWLWYFLRPFGKRPADWLCWQGGLGGALRWGVGGYLAALPLVVVSSLISQALLKNQGGGNPLLEIILQSRDYTTFALLYIMVAVMAPFFEEILFRGFFFRSVQSYLPLGTAMGVTGLLFAIAHLNLADLLPLTVLGTVLSYIYWRSHNIGAAMILHSIWNSGSFLGLLLLSGGTEAGF